MQDFTISLIIVFLALFIDLVFGDPSNRFHPTAWVGRIAKFLIPHLRTKNPKSEKINGFLLVASLASGFSALTYVILSTAEQYLPLAAYVIIAAVFLKLTFAIKGMERASLKVKTALEGGDIHKARENLSCIVGRDTSKLDRKLILSATVESIGENTVDGITSALFYFALFGIPGAVAFRVINTLDSMVGYKDSEHKNIGWFPAKIDSILNFIPARLTAGFMVASALLLGEDYRNSWRILKRDHSKTASWNAGYPMSAMAGALCIRLEKLGHYVLGDENETICANHVFRALRMMKVSTLLFLIFIIPLVWLMSTLGV